MKALDIAVQLAKTHFKEERGDWDALLPTYGYKWISFEVLNLIIYLIEVEYYKRYKKRLISAEDDILACLCYGPVYDSIIKEVIHNPSINMLGYLSGEERLSYYIDNTESINDPNILSVIDDVYLFLYGYLRDESDKSILIRYFKATELFEENYVPTDMIRTAINEINRYYNCFDLSFVLLAFKEEYKDEMIHTLMENENKKHVESTFKPKTKIDRLKEEVLSLFDI